MSLCNKNNLNKNENFFVNIFRSTYFFRFFAPTSIHNFNRVFCIYYQKLYSTTTLAGSINIFLFLGCKVVYTLIYFQNSLVGHVYIFFFLIYYRVKMSCWWNRQRFIRWSILFQYIFFCNLGRHNNRSWSTLLLENMIIISYHTTPVSIRLEINTWCMEYFWILIISISVES